MALCKAKSYVALIRYLVIIPIHIYFTVHGNCRMASMVLTVHGKLADSEWVLVIAHQYTAMQVTCMQINIRVTNANK